MLTRNVILPHDRVAIPLDTLAKLAPPSLHSPLRIIPIIPIKSLVVQGQPGITKADDRSISLPGKESQLLLFCYLSLKLAQRSGSGVLVAQQLSYLLPSALSSLLLFLFSPRRNSHNMQHGTNADGLRLLYT